MTRVIERHRVVCQWSRDDLSSGRERWVLSAPGFVSPYRPDGKIGHVAHDLRNHGPLKWRGEAQTGWGEHQATGGVWARSKAAAMRRLEAEIDRRSIGLFGCDLVAFEGPA